MVRNLVLSVALVVASSSMALAQCKCGSCGDGSIGSNYTTMDSVYGKMSSGGCSDGDCFGVDGDRDCGALSRCQYLSLFGGGNWMESFQESNILQNSVNVDRGGFEDGYAVGMAIGSQVHPNVRYELEGTFRNNDADEWYVEDFTAGVVTASTRTPATGELESFSSMVNVLFDLPSRQPNCLNFYGGVGIGGLFVDGEIVSAGNTYDVSDSSFAFQAIAGVTKAISTRVDLYGEYRFLNAQNILVEDLASGTSLGDFEFKSNSLFLGLRFRR